jgi:serine/threonine protein phosphatase PrpC
MSSIARASGVVAARASVALLERLDAVVPWAAITDPGPGRPHNEDRWLTDDPHGVFALADGMGGYNAGEIASEIAVRTVVELVGALHEAGLPTDAALSRAVAAAHAGIVDFAHARPECLGMGTTVVAAVIDGARLTVAHVGDSRAYLMRGGVLRRITADHSVGQQMLDAGRLSDEQVRRLPARGILTRALGVESEPPQADLNALDWLPGDLLMLCSDGLTDSLDDAALAAVLGRSGLALADGVRELLAAALGAGCTDNVTILIAGGVRAPALNH